MELNLEKILWFLIFIDSISTNIIFWFYPNWYQRKFGSMSKYFPTAKGWGFMYFFLVLWIGYAVFRI